MPSYNLHRKTFRSAANTDNGDVDSQTTFHYFQQEQTVWAEYAGGKVLRGSIIGKWLSDDKLEIRYQHLDDEGNLRTGQCFSTPEILPDGRLRLHEAWQWTSGDHSSGKSVIEETSTNTPL